MYIIHIYLYNVYNALDIVFLYICYSNTLYILYT